MLKYYPKNRVVTDLYTSGGSFSLNGQDYVGYYYKTFDGKVYSGATPQSPGGGQRLFPVYQDVSVSPDRPLNLPNLQNVSLETLVPYYPTPTPGDYKKGYFVRYFAKKANQPDSIIEISKQDYDNMRNGTALQADKIMLYQVIDVFWKLTGPLKDNRVNKQYPVAGIINTNQRIVETKEKDFRGLKTYIGENYSKFAIPS